MVAEFVVYVIGPTKPADGEKKRHEQVSQEQFPITYYFHDNGRSSLAANVPTLVRIAEGAAGEGNPPPVHLSAAELRHVIDDFSATIASSFLGLPSDPTEKVLDAYARDHLREPPGNARARP